MVPRGKDLVGHGFSVELCVIDTGRGDVESGSGNGRLLAWGDGESTRKDRQWRTHAAARIFDPPGCSPIGALEQPGPEPAAASVSAIPATAAMSVPIHCLRLGASRFACMTTLLIDMLRTQETRPSVIAPRATVTLRDIIRACRAGRL